MIRMILSQFVHQLICFQQGQVIGQKLTFFFITPGHYLHVARGYHGRIKKHAVHNAIHEPLKENNHGHSQCYHKNWKKTPGSVSDYTFS
jgi:hypothetical protein